MSNISSSAALVKASPRQTNRPRWHSGITLAILIIILAWSYRGTRINLVGLVDGRQAMTRFVTRMFPPDLGVEFLRSTVSPFFETIQISIMGTFLGAMFGVPLALLAARPRTGGVLERLLYQGTRTLLNLFRSVPKLVWAIIFIVAVGLGPYPGVLAITVCSTGCLGKLYAEIMEAVDEQPVTAIRATGAPELLVTVFAILPQAWSNFIALTLYEWEINVREATILGFVGAGGLGQQIDFSMRLFQYDRTLTLLIIVLLLVTAVDRLSTWLRSRWALNY